MPYGRPLRGLETRLALIHEGKWQDPITCSFEYESFEENSKVKQSYSALSYVWGNSKAKETIQIDGHEHKISVNLACAIRHLRDEKHLVLIWIDAIVSLAWTLFRGKRLTHFVFSALIRTILTKEVPKFQ